LPVMLDDALQQLRRSLAEWRVQAQHIVNRLEVVEPYNDRDKEHVLYRLSASDYGDTNGLRGDVRFRFFKAGHVLGAGSVLIESPDTKVFVTGDFSDFDQRTVDGLRWPGDVANPDLMIMEATYGSVVRPSREEAIRVL